MGARKFANTPLSSLLLLQVFPWFIFVMQKYKRRIIALNSGRLTLYYKPFACLGDIETDAIKLFLDAYKAYIDEVSK